MTGLFCRLRDLLQDSANGRLYYMRNRWYDPETGRFLSEDPIGLTGGINLYQFAMGDPINYRDPLGTTVCFNGTDDDKKDLRGIVEDATGTRITKMDGNCIDDFESVNSGFAQLQTGLRNLMDSWWTYTIAFGEPGQDAAGAFSPGRLGFWGGSILIARPARSVLCISAGCVYVWWGTMFMGVLWRMNCIMRMPTFSEGGLQIC